jgi:hypothetical protein
MKDGPEGDTVACELKVVEVGTNNDGKPITSCVVVPVEDGVAPQEKKAAKEPASNRTFREAFDEASITHGQMILIRNDGPQVRAVDLAHVQAEFNQRWATGELNLKKRADAQRNTFKRAKDRLSLEYPTWVQGVWKA